MNIFHSFSAIVPSEIQKHDPEVQRAFFRAMWSGEVQVYRGRIMFIGQDRAGKTSLKKSLLGIPFDPQEDSTVGIEVDPSKFEVDVDHAINWQPTEQKDLAVHEFEDDIAKIIATEYQNSLSVQVIAINNIQGFLISFTRAFLFLVSFNFLIIIKFYILGAFLIKQSLHSRLLDMRLFIANSALRASLAIYHLISNAHSWNNC